MVPCHEKKNIIKNGRANVRFSINNVSNCPVSNCPVSNCPVSNCPVSNCPVSNCPVRNCPVSNCPVSNCPVSICPVSKCPGIEIQHTLSLGNLQTRYILDIMITLARTSSSSQMTRGVREMLGRCIRSVW